MPRPPITVTIITFNEEENILNAVQSASWAEEILVVDSGSTDRTLELLQFVKTPSLLRILKNSWPGYGQQKNFAQNHATHDWILNLDADEMISPELKQEIETALEQVAQGVLNAQGFYFPRKTFYLGRWIQHGGWYPNSLVRLAHRKFACWTEPHVHEELKVNGNIIPLKSALDHYAFSNIQDQVLTNLRFSRLGSEELKQKGQKPSLFKLFFKPIGKFIETYLIKCGFLDGLPGFIISINAAHSMFLKYAYLFEEKIKVSRSQT